MYPLVNVHHSAVIGAVVKKKAAPHTPCWRCVVPWRVPPAPSSRRRCRSLGCQGAGGGGAEPLGRNDILDPRILAILTPVGPAGGAVGRFRSRFRDVPDLDPWGLLRVNSPGAFGAGDPPGGPPGDPSGTTRGAGGAVLATGSRVSEQHNMEFFAANPSRRALTGACVVAGIWVARWGREGAATAVAIAQGSRVAAPPPGAPRSNPEQDGSSRSWLRLGLSKT
eukprot:gene12521-biopygen9492